MAENNRDLPRNRHVGSTRAHDLLFAVAAVWALIAIPLLLSAQVESDEADPAGTVLMLFGGLSSLVLIGAVVVKRTAFREHRGSALTEDEMLAELEAQFDADRREPKA